MTRYRQVGIDWRPTRDGDYLPVLISNNFSGQVTYYYLSLVYREMLSPLETHNIMICDKVTVIPEVEERDPAKLL